MSDILHLPPGLPEMSRVAGVDEAGRGALAGPVAAAAVVLHEDHGIEGLADSKKLSPKKRAYLAGRIRECAVGYSVAFVPAAQIDRINILQATLAAMTEAVSRLPEPPEWVLADGNVEPPMDCPTTAIVKGDDRVPAISAASILAKEARDAWMRMLHVLDDRYGFDVHKGYPSPAHCEILRTVGPGPHHRYSYAPVREAQEKFS